MIEPLVKEAEWLGFLSKLPDWSPPRQEIVVISPHPDDETLATGGLIAVCRRRGIQVTVAAVTDGERAYPDTVGLAQLRREEQRQALAILGVGSDHIIRFGLPDGGVTACLPELVDQINRVTSAETHLVAPWRGDFHPDHQACGHAAEEVARQSKARLTSYFFWTWHFGTPDLLRELNLSQFALDSNALLLKSEALACHQSQLHRPTGDPILPGPLLLPAQRPFEVFAIA